MSEYESIVFDVQDAIARLTLNRPAKLNSFTAQMHEEIASALARLKEDSIARVLVIAGAGRGFCAGQDLSEFNLDDSNSFDLGAVIDRYYAPLVRAILNLPMPVIAAVNGIAAGGGANMAFACDLVIAARSASFVEPFCRLGLIPDTGGSYFLPRLAGTARAMGLALLGDKISAQQAADWGLIWQCVDDDQFANTVEKLASDLAQAPTRAIACIKQAIYSGLNRTLDQQLDVERDLMRELGRSHDFREGVAAFIEKRPPRFTGR
jgi:2-(1,2-epoxy-1,2-dihydrophenyl)acetyl-CoA isomerase